MSGDTVRIFGASGDPALEGLWRPGSTGDVCMVIAAPHPGYGGSLDNHVVDSIAQAAQAAQRASLRFNWRGVGASDGEVTGDGECARLDYAAALAWLAARGFRRAVAAGYSFGALAALRTALNPASVAVEITGLVLVAPPVAMLRDLPLAQLVGPVRIACGEHDAYASVAHLQASFAAARDATVAEIRGADHFFSAGDGGLRSWLMAIDLAGFGG